MDLQTDKNKRKIAQLQKENKEKRLKLKELLEVDFFEMTMSSFQQIRFFREMKKCWTKHSVAEKMNEQRWKTKLDK